MDQNAVSPETKHQAYGTKAYDAAGSAIMSFTPINQSVHLRPSRKFKR